MGDRCYMEITCHKQDQERFTALGFVAQDWKQDNSALVVVVDEQANYGHCGDLPTDIPYHGFSGSGGDYGEAVFACDGTRYAEVETGRPHLPVTLSIGVGKGGGEKEPALLGRLAQEALDLALERGGDQVVVKSPEHTWFYGGHTEAVGKRNQVRSRVTATELHRLFELCNNVVIMGHRGIDFDVLGAAFALAEAARHYD